MARVLELRPLGGPPKILDSIEKQALRQVRW